MPKTNKNTQPTKSAEKFIAQITIGNKKFKATNVTLQGAFDDLVKQIPATLYKTKVVLDVKYGKTEKSLVFAPIKAKRFLTETLNRSLWAKLFTNGVKA